MQGFNVTVLVAALVALAPSARAQTRTTKTTVAPDHYRYVFDDDPLDAGALSSLDARVRVMPHLLRQTLLRPRVSFVPEMLASVETL